MIAAAGGAAHLPDMVAAKTWLLIIGVPVRGNSFGLRGQSTKHTANTCRCI